MRPTTKKLDLVETLHGTPVPDPYRWLEDGESEEVRAWTAAQNAHTRERLDAVAGRDALEREVRTLLQIGYVSAPSIRTTKEGVRRYFTTRREGTQNQPVIYVRDGANGEDRVLLDGSALSEDGTTAIDWWYPSRDGARVAWGRSESGSEESTLFVRDVATGEELPDRIPYARYASVAWLPSGDRFFYSRYPAPGTVPEGDEKYGSRIYLHVLGDDPARDVLVFGEGRDKTDMPAVMTSPDGRWLVVQIHMGWDRSEVWLKDLAAHEAASGDGWVPVAVGEAALFEPIPRNDRLYLHTNSGAPRYALHAVDFARPERGAWKLLVPEGEDVLESAIVLAGEIVTTYLHDASSRVLRFGLDGSPRGEVVLPGIGSAGVSGAWDGDELFVSFTSFVVPNEVWRLDLATGGPLTAWSRVRATFAAEDIEVERRYATSKDGTRIPMFVIAKKGTPRDGTSAAALYGYGGFNVSMTPAFSARALASVRHGCIWVTAVLRGGGELGEQWHEGGMLARKQNTFDDFIACAESLVAEGLASKDRLAIIGGSNGGLLVAAALTQRPDLFRAALSLVPLTDMLRYHLFRIAKLWIPEYGDPDREPDFTWLRAYSPYHRVTAGVRYPATLLATAESDSRVDPMHARKMAAALQDAQAAADRPVLLRVETKAGHGAGKPVSKVADEVTDELSFLLHELGVPLLPALNS
ncbi:MAG: Prolyl endopeptidase [Labilithrix sp.]|nr:Prolyl endopeptidase [Labilithrix sp.]